MARTLTPGENLIDETSGNRTGIFGRRMVRQHVVDRTRDGLGKPNLGRLAMEFVLKHSENLIDFFVGQTAKQATHWEHQCVVGDLRIRHAWLWVAHTEYRVGWHVGENRFAVVFLEGLSVKIKRPDGIVFATERNASLYSR